MTPLEQAPGSGPLADNDDDDERHMRAIIRRMVVDPHLADDVAQETWLQTLRRPEGSFQARRAWMGTVARNFVLQASRSSARRRKREKAVARSVIDIREAPDPELLAAVREELEQLDPRYRSVLHLRFFEDLPPTMIADQLSIPIETARTRLKRGLSALHARLIARRQAAATQTGDNGTALGHVPLRERRAIGKS